MISDEAFNRLEWSAAGIADLQGLTIEEAEPIVYCYSDAGAPIYSGVILFTVDQAGNRAAFDIGTSEDAGQGLHIYKSDIKREAN